MSNDELKVKVDILNIEPMKEMIKIISEILNDEDIDKDIRISYMNKLNEVLDRMDGEGKLSYV